MSLNGARLDAIANAIDFKSPSVNFKDVSPEQLFGQDVFGLAEMKARLPKDVFKTLKRNRLVASREGGPYHITREGLERLRPQLDNRTSGRKW